MGSSTPRKDEMHVVQDALEDALEDRLDGPGSSADCVESSRYVNYLELQEVRWKKKVAVGEEDYDEASRLKKREMELMQLLAMEDEKADAKPHDHHEKGGVSMEVPGFSRPLAELDPDDQRVPLFREQAEALVRARAHANLFDKWMSRAFPDGVPYTNSDMQDKYTKSTEYGQPPMSSRGLLEEGSYGESTQHYQPHTVSSSSNQNVVDTQIRLQFPESTDTEHRERIFEPSGTADEQFAKIRLASKASGHAPAEDSDDLFSDSEEEGAEEGPYAQEISPDADLETVKMIPLTSAGRLTSIGSIGHKKGECTPCLLVNMLDGCPEGINCVYCHFKHKKRKPRGKGKRQRYRGVLDKLKAAVREDPEGFDYELNSVTLPSRIEDRSWLKEKLKKSLLAEAALIQQEREAEAGYALTHDHHQFTSSAGPLQTQSSRIEYNF